MERVVLDAGKARDDVSRPTPCAHVPFRGSSEVPVLMERILLLHEEATML